MISKPTIHNILSFFLRYVLPVAFTVLLLIYLFHKVDFRKMFDLISHGVDYWWILLAMGLSIFSHIFRAARWRIQLDALDVRPPFMALCCSIFGCYALNLVFPRLGELWRCTYVSSYKKSSFSNVFGSMVADRVADSITVLLLLVLSLIVATPAIHTFLDRYSVGRNFVHLFSEFWFWAAVIGALALIVVLLVIFRKRPFMIKLKQSALAMWKGFIIIAGMPGKIRFIILTICIWGCYFIQLYVAFFAFDFTRSLCTQPGLGFGLVPCLVAFVLSSISMAIPSNGGLGPWNIAIMFGLAIYGISDAEGTAFSMLQWSGETVMLIFLGIFTMIYISLSKTKRNKDKVTLTGNVAPEIK